MFSWDELLPKVKKVIVKYFVEKGKEVEFRVLSPVTG